MNELEARITNLEIRFAHQEATIEQLNDVIVRQQGILAKLTHELTTLHDQIARLADRQPVAVTEEPPPHY